MLAHGAGSTAEFVVRTFGAALGELGIEVASWDRPHSSSYDEDVVDFEVHAQGAQIVGGVSYGAHLAAQWSARGHSCQNLLLALPAWIGPASGAAVMTSATGDEIADNGIADTLRRVDRDAPAWVAREMHAAWSTYDDAALAQALHTAGSAPAPTESELRGIETPAIVLGMTDDPFHPIEIAHQWAELLPNAVLVEVDYGLGNAAPEFGIAAASALELIL